MSYQGIVFAITVGVAIGVAIYNYFAPPGTLQHGQRTNDTRDSDYSLQPRSASAGNRSRWVCKPVKISFGSWRLFFRRRRKDDTCSICLVKFKGDRDIVINTRTFLCGHTFHNHCITSWHQTGNSTCPNCRERLYFNNWQFFSYQIYQFLQNF